MNYFPLRHPFISLGQILRSGITGLYNQCRCNFILLKTRGPKWSHWCWAPSPNQEFTTVSSYPQNRFLKRVNEEFPDQHWLKSLAWWTPTSPKGKWLRNNHTDFLLSVASYSAHSPYEGLVLCTPHRSSFLTAGWASTPFMNHWVKPMRSLKFTQLPFVFFFFKQKEMTIDLQSCCTFCICTNNEWEFQLLHIFASTCFYVSKFQAILIRHIVMSPCGFNLHLLNDSGWDG